MEESYNTIETREFGDDSAEEISEQRIDPLNIGVPEKQILGDNSSYASTEVGLTMQSSSEPRYEVRDGHLYKIDGNKEACLANFHLEIAAQHLRLDESVQVRRDLKLDVHLNDRTIPVIVSSEDFCSHRLVNQIVEEAGPEAIIYCGHKDLRIAAQKLSPTPIPTTTITTSMGFTRDGSYLAPGMIISAEGINQTPNFDLDLSEGNFSPQIGFLPPKPSLVKDIVCHLHKDFFQLKAHRVTYPLIGHILLAPFASQIGIIGKQKPVMHLQGPSGGGKTFLGNLASSFYGTFEDRPLPWTSTANAIESEGFYFRDALFFIDDFKTAIVDPNKVIRIIQNSANSQGRARLSSGGGYKLTPMRGVRGLILSTGEDFISDVESVAGRTILITVEPDQNIEAGMSCWRSRSQYRMLIPDLLAWLLTKLGWQQNFRDAIDRMTEDLAAQIVNLSNGTRLASNWALNAFGFSVFIEFSRHLEIIDEKQAQDLLAEYETIMMGHIAAHAAQLQNQNPVEVFFRILSQKFATGVVRVNGLNGQKTGKVIGKVRDYGNIVCLFPDPCLEFIYSHFRSVGQRPPFTKETLRDALVRDGILLRSGSSRVAHQVRVNGSRLQAWQFGTVDFKERCGMTEEK